MYILILEVLAGLASLLVGLLVAVVFGSLAREGAGVYGDPSPQPTRRVVLDQAGAAPRLLNEIRQADGWIARELGAIPPVAKRRVGQGVADLRPGPQHHVARVG
jgi:hypothetical protein